MDIPTLTSAPPSTWGTKTLLLVRHAECEANLTMKTRIVGRSSDSPLTARGVQQAQALGQHLAVVTRHTQLPSCYSSTAVRTLDTLRLALDAVAKVQPQVPVQAYDELLEVCQGDWEGQIRAEKYTSEVLDRVRQDPYTFAAPNGESPQQAEQRIHDFVRKTVLPQLEFNGPPALLMAHGSLIKCFLRGVMDSNPRFTRKILIDNTSVTEVVWVEKQEGSGWELIRVNDCTHLHLAGLGQPPNHAA